MRRQGGRARRQGGKEGGRTGREGENKTGREETVRKGRREDGGREGRREDGGREGEKTEGGREGEKTGREGEKTGRERRQGGSETRRHREGRSPLKTGEVRTLWALVKRNVLDRNFGIQPLSPTTISLQSGLERIGQEEQSTC